MRPSVFKTALALAGAALVFACSSEDRGSGDKAGGDAPPPPALGPGGAPAPETPTNGGASKTIAIVEDGSSGPEVTLSVLGRYKDPAFGASGLPALSADGRLIAYTEELLDGGRGNPNLRFLIRSIETDRPINKIEVLAPSPRWSPEDEPVVRGRLEAVDTLLAASSWQQMKASTFEDNDGMTPILLIGELEVTISARALVVSRRGARVLSRPLSGLLGRNPEPSCELAPQVSEAYAVKRALLIRVEFVGRGGCTRESEYHALTLR